MSREDEIQKLLRHAFMCTSKNHKCSCAKNIQTFLLNDKVSLKWAERQKKLYQA